MRPFNVKFKPMNGGNDNKTYTDCKAVPNHDAYTTLNTPLRFLNLLLTYARKDMVGNSI
jgi:hypothetical protein